MRRWTSSDFSKNGCDFSICLDEYMIWGETELSYEFEPLHISECNDIDPTSQLHAHNGWDK